MQQIRAEFHCHSIFSKDSLVEPERLVETCRRKGIDKVVITDHNQIEGAQIAHTLDPQRVIVGEEIMTDRGEILAAYVTERIPAGLDPFQTIAALRSQGAFVGVSHPFDHRREGAWDLDDLLKIAPLVDAIETFNSRCLSGEPNAQAVKFAQEHGLAGTAGSDAHIPWELGRGNLLMPDFNDPQGLKSALGQAKLLGSLSPWWVHFLSYYARRSKKITGNHIQYM
jgi:predicted metal-dependent phosphoesterase TrpH